MDYRKDTRDAYRNELKARQYQEQYTKGTKWARFTMWRQKHLIDRIMGRCGFKETSRILDIPCGTGFIGNILSRTPASIIASDISTEMMERARGEYAGDNFQGFVQCDITQTPFKKESFDCVVLLAFMHRLPKEIRYRTWENILELSKRFIVVNYSIDSRSQRLKQRLIKTMHSKYVPAPSSLSVQEIVKEIKSFDLVIQKVFYVAYFLSGKIVFLLEKKARA